MIGGKRKRQDTTQLVGRFGRGADGMHAVVGACTGSDMLARCRKRQKAQRRLKDLNLPSQSKQQDGPSKPRSTIPEAHSRKSGWVGRSFIPWPLVPRRPRRRRRWLRYTDRYVGS